MAATLFPSSSPTVPVSQPIEDLVIGIFIAMFGVLILLGCAVVATTALGTEVYYLRRQLRVLPSSEM